MRQLDAIDYLILFLTASLGVCLYVIWNQVGGVSGQVNNPYQVTKLFSVETCNVYRFKDGWFNTQYLVECERGPKVLGPIKYYDPNTHEGKGKKPS
jgi:hypothetical protein